MYKVVRTSPEEPRGSDPTVFEGSYEACVAWLRQQRKWRRYAIVDCVTGRFMSFVL